MCLKEEIELFKHDTPGGASIVPIAFPLVAGAGSIWGNDKEEEVFEQKLLPSAGLGLRFMVSREKRRLGGLKL